MGRLITSTMETIPIRPLDATGQAKIAHGIVRQAKPGQDEPDFYWDFSAARHVSYSWQAPVVDKNGKFRQGLSDVNNDAVVTADKTPAAGATQWNHKAWDPALTGPQVWPHMSPNHRGGQVNALYVGMNVAGCDRPDIGVARDMIYTAARKTKRGDRKATSIDIKDHMSRRDTFLIGPVAGKAGPGTP